MALDSGVSVREYWDLTLQEIYDIIESYGRTLERTKKERITELFVLAEVTANRVLFGFNSKRSYSDLVQPWHYYPGLFDNMEEDIEEQREIAETEKYKAKFNRHVDAWNRRFMEANNGGSREISRQSDGGDDGRTEKT